MTLRNIRTDLVDEDLTTEEPNIIVEKIYDLQIATYSVPDRQTTIAPAKEIEDVIDLVKKCIDSYESRSGVTNDGKLQLFSYEEPETASELEAITVTPGTRLPGKISGGGASRSVGATEVREVRPHLREEIEDPDSHGYRLAILGQYFDNWVDFTCWGRTTKQAAKRARWFENLMEEHMWFLTAMGVGRILYQGGKDRVVKRIDNNTIYGYPLTYYIRTEKITRFSEKTLERLVIELGLTTS